MSTTRGAAEDTSKSSSLARSFSRLGWLGFWAQIVIGFFPILLTTYTFIFNRNAGGGTRGGFALVEILALAGLLVLAFTTIWFYRYTRLAVRIADPQNRPPALVVRRAAWTGVAASVVGIVFSGLVMLFDVIQILFIFSERLRSAFPPCRQRPPVRQRVGSLPPTS